jgi:hypothetical protein
MGWDECQQLWGHEQAWLCGWVKLKHTTDFIQTSIYSFIYESIMLGNGSDYGNV